MSTSSRARGERGATVVEFALVLPALLLLALGTVEMSIGWVAHDRAQTASSQAARVAAVSGSRVQADRDILLALQAALPADELSHLDRVVIFNPTTALPSVPAGCVKTPGSTSQTGLATCNTYTGATVRAVTSTSMTGFGGGITAADRFWKPVDRKDTLAGPPDFIGVWLRTTYDSPTGGFFGQITLTKVTTFRIQPDLTG